MIARRAASFLALGAAAALALTAQERPPQAAAGPHSGSPPSLVPAPSVVPDAGPLVPSCAPDEPSSSAVASPSSVADMETDPESSSDSG